MAINITGKPVGPVGFGLMGFTSRNPPTPYEEAFKVMKAALDAGANFWNGGDFYGPPHANSLHLLAAYFTAYPEDADKVVISIKGGFSFATMTQDNSPDAVRATLDNALAILAGKCTIDIYEPARVDPNVPIETVMAALAPYVTDGRIGGIGLSECSAATLIRAHAVHPIAAVEIELSLSCPDPLTNGMAAAAAERSVPIIAYSPLGHGLLTGAIRSTSDLPTNDFRRSLPRFADGVLDANLRLVHEVERIAEAKGASLPQTAIAWVCAQTGRAAPGLTVLPIPGATTVARVQENMRAVTLGAEEVAALDEAVAKVPMQGARYGGPLASLTDG